MEDSTIVSVLFLKLILRLNKTNYDENSEKVGDGLDITSVPLFPDGVLPFS